jgi:hypothetical protein
MNADIVKVWNELYDAKASMEVIQVAFQSNVTNLLKTYASSREKGVNELKQLLRGECQA